MRRFANQNGQTDHSRSSMTVSAGFLHSFSRFSLVFALLIGTSLGFVACGGGSDDDPSEGQSGNQGEPTGDPVYGGIFRMNETDGIRTLDPVQMNDAPSHHVVHQVAESLVDFNENLELINELAENWEVSEDQKTYTYHIRKGVMFHDSPCFPDGKGRELKAQDVKFCFDRILDLSSGTKGADYFRDKVVGAASFSDATMNGPAPAGGVPGFRVLDDYTFQIELNAPFPAFKYYPALGMCYIYPPEAVEHFGKDFFRNIVATGPFHLKSWKQDQELILERNPNYWRTDDKGNRLPYLDGVRFSFIGDQSTMLTDFKNGNLEENYRIPNEFVEVIFEPREPGSTDAWKLSSEWSQFQLQQITELSSQYYGMLTTSDVFSDKRVRQAFNYAIDRVRIIGFVLKGQSAGPANHGLVPPSMPNYPIDMVKGYEFDPDKARALMSEAGFPNGQNFPAVTLQYNEGGGRNTTIAEAIQDELKTNLGITIALKPLQFAQHLDQIDAGNSPFFRLGWIADYPEPENFLNLLYGKNARPVGQDSPLNSTRYNNPRFDSLYEQALATPDDTERYRLYAEAEQVAVEDAPMLWIVYDMQFRLVQPWVRGYHSNAMDRRDLTWTWIDPSVSGSPNTGRAVAAEGE